MTVQPVVPASMPTNACPALMPTPRCLLAKESDGVRGLEAASGAGGTVEDALDELVGPAAGQQQQVGQGEAVTHERQAAKRPPGPLRVHRRSQVGEAQRRT